MEIEGSFLGHMSTDFVLLCSMEVQTDPQRSMMANLQQQYQQQQQQRKNMVLQENEKLSKYVV